MILAILRDIALNLLRETGIATIAAQLLAISRHPETVLPLLTLAERQNA